MRGRALRGLGSAGAALPLAKEKREQHEAPALAHLRHFVQVRAGEHEGAAGRRAVEVGPILRKPQVPALVARVQVQAQGKTTVRGGRAQVVAVGAEHAPRGGVIAGNREAFEACGPEGKGLGDLGHHPAPDRGGQMAHERRLPHRVVAAAFAVGTQGGLAPVPAGLLDAGGDVALGLPDVDQGLAEILVERVGAALPRC